MSVPRKASTTQFRFDMTMALIEPEVMTSSPVKPQFAAISPIFCGFSYARRLASALDAMIRQREASRFSAPGEEKFVSCVLPKVQPASTSGVVLSSLAAPVLVLQPASNMPVASNLIAVPVSKEFTN